MPFGYTKKVKQAPRKRKKPTEDELMKGIAGKRLSDIASKNLTVQASLIKKHFDIEVPESDESKDSEKKLRGQFYTNLLKKYEGADEETVFTDREEEILDKILGTKRGPGGSRYPNEYLPGGEGDGTDNIEEFADRYEKLAARFGGRSGTFGFLKDPEVATALIGFIQNMLGKGPPAGGNGPTGSRIYVVDIDGEAVEMPEAAYRAFLSQQRRLRNAEAIALTAGRTEEKSPAKPTELKKETTGAPGVIRQQADDGSEVLITPIYVDKNTKRSEEGPQPAAPPPEVDITSFLPLATGISEAMDGDPDLFAIELIEAANEGIAGSYDLAIFLKDMTYDKILVMLEPYRPISAVEDYINKFEKNREWVEKALAKIQSLPLIEQFKAQE